MFGTLLLSLLAQDPAPQPATVEPATAQRSVALVPAKDGARGGPRWSPKAASVPLTASKGALQGSFTLGQKGTAAFRVSLGKSDGAAHVDMLWIDLDRDGKESPVEQLRAEPKETRGKWWSSFQTTT